MLCYKQFNTAKGLCSFVNDNNIEVVGIANTNEYYGGYTLFYRKKEE